MAKSLNRLKMEKQDSIDELFRCPICLENLKTPKMLPCGHVFCLECLKKEEQLQSTGYLKSCSVCRQTPFPNVKVELLPQAYLAQQMMDRIPYMRAKSDPTEVIDIIIALVTKREDLKKEEETKAKRLLDEKKAEITQNIDQVALDLLQRVNATLDSRKKYLLRNVQLRYENKIEHLQRYVQQADDASQVKAWLRASISDELTVPEPLMKVLPVEVHELNTQLRREHSHDDILKSLDPEAIIRRKLGRETKPIIRQEGLKEEDNEADVEQVPKPLTSLMSETTLVNDPKNLISDVFVTLEPPDLSVSEKTTCPFVSVKVNVQHWIKDGDKPDEYYVSTESSTRSRIASEPKKSIESANKLEVSRTVSYGSTPQTFQRKFQLTLKGSGGSDSFHALRLQVTRDFTSIATEDENKTEMRVFTSEDTIRRRHLLSSQTSEKRPNVIVAITALSENNGWCMLFKTVLLIFDYHGRLDKEYPFDNSVLCASSYKQDQFVFVNDVFEIGLISIAGNNIIMVSLQPDTHLFSGGKYFAMTAANDTLYIAHTENEQRNGNVICFTGLEKEYSLMKKRTFNPPSGFAEVSHPVSICCKQNDIMFALWRDKDSKRGIIMEYCVKDQLSIPNIVMENADNIFTITCSYEGHLVTVSLET